MNEEEEGVCELAEFVALLKANNVGHISDILISACIDCVAVLSLCSTTDLKELGITHLGDIVRLHRLSQSNTAPPPTNNNTTTPTTMPATTPATPVPTRTPKQVI
eukprot:TRINITY_DN6962_c0_g4_i1.p2 TRINITY_DN6962_c0_g4~~TRINITY_DN6962_c0_g4_i1.p2  ORF type:complete len:105 (+),score=38.00 TRINITY_DN6962_c0_g4_i1:178-492(+)